MDIIIPEDSCPVCNGDTDFKCMTCGRGGVNIAITDCYTCEVVKECKKVEGVFLCDSCFQDNYFTCTSCGKAVFQDEMGSDLYQEICMFCLD